MAARTSLQLDDVRLGEDIVTALYLGDQLVWVGGGLFLMDMLYVPDEFEEG